MKSCLKFLTLGIAFLLAAAIQHFPQQLHPAETAKAARTTDWTFKATLYFYNDTANRIKLYWLETDGSRKFLIAVPAGQNTPVTTWLSQPWVVTDEKDNALGLYYPDAQPRTIRIGNREQISAANTAPVTGESAVSNRSRDDEDEDYYDSFRDSKLKYDETPITICRDQKIPRGFLITSAGNDFNCPGWNAVNKNTYTIRRPSLTNPTQICGNQEIPLGFVITRASNDFNCPGWNAVNSNAYVIKRPAETDVMCAVSNVPRNFVVTGAANEFNCPNWSAVGSNAKRIRRIR